MNSSVEQSSIVLDNKAKLYIIGTGNKINGNEGYAVYLKNGSYIESKKKNTYMQNNQKYAIGLYNKSTAVVKYATLTKNKKGTAYVGKGSTLKLTDCKTSKIVKGTTL